MFEIIRYLQENNEDTDGFKRLLNKYAEYSA